MQNLTDLCACMTLTRHAKSDWCVCLSDFNLNWTEFDFYFVRYWTLSSSSSSSSSQTWDIHSTWLLDMWPGFPGFLLDVVSESSSGSASFPFPSGCLFRCTYFPNGLLPFCATFSLNYIFHFCYFSNLYWTEKESKKMLQ